MSNMVVIVTGTIIVCQEPYVASQSMAASSASCKCSDGDHGEMWW